MAVFFTNVCKFSDCGLTFPSLRQLIEHIEDSHIGECSVSLLTELSVDCCWYLVNFVQVQYASSVVTLFVSYSYWAGMHWPSLALGTKEMEPGGLTLNMTKTSHNFGPHYNLIVIHIKPTKLNFSPASYKLSSNL